MLRNCVRVCVCVGKIVIDIVDLIDVPYKQPLASIVRSRQSVKRMSTSTVSIECVIGEGRRRKVEEGGRRWIRSCGFFFEGKVEGR